MKHTQIIQTWNSEGDRAIAREAAAARMLQDSMEPPEIDVIPPPPPRRFTVNLQIEDGSYDVETFVSQLEANGFVVFGVEWEMFDLLDAEGNVIPMVGNGNMMERFVRIFQCNQGMMNACRKICKTGEGIILVDFRKMKNLFGVQTMHLHQWMPMLKAHFAKQADYRDFASFHYKIIIPNIPDLFAIWFVNESGWVDVDVGEFETEMCVGRSANLNKIATDKFGSEWSTDHSTIVQLVRDFWISRDTWRKTNVFDLRGLTGYDVTALNIYESARDVQLFPESPAENFSLLWISNNVALERGIIESADNESHKMFERETSVLKPTIANSNWRKAYVQQV